MKTWHDTYHVSHDWRTWTSGKNWYARLPQWRCALVAGSWSDLLTLMRATER